MLNLNQFLYIQYRGLVNSFCQSQTWPSYWRTLTWRIRMPLLKIDWRETKGVFRKRTTTHVRITSAWTLTRNPDTNETQVLFLDGTGHIKISNAGSFINSSCDVPFRNKIIPVTFELVLQYVETCIADGKLIDLTSMNCHNIKTEYSSNTLLSNSL